MTTSRLYWIFLISFSALFTKVIAHEENDKFGQKYVEFDIVNNQFAFEGGLPQGVTYVPSVNLISAIKVYKDIVYVTIPRHGHKGIPATLAKISKPGGVITLSPFPNWDYQKQDSSCKGLYDARSLEVDPKKELMYIVDNGDPKYNCSAKLVVYDLAKNALNLTYDLETVLNNDKKSDRRRVPVALGDITVDKNGIVYIANADKYGSLLIVETNTAKKKGYRVSDHSFKGTGFKAFVFENDTYWKNDTINMLAMTSDNKFVFFSSNDQGLWQFESNLEKQDKSLQFGEITGARMTGEKNHHGFHILMGDRFLFFSNVDNKSISYWDRKSDLDKQNQGENALVKENEVLVKIDPKLKYFPGKMSLDDKGYLWVVTMDFPMFFNDSDPLNMPTRIVKIFVDNRPYNSLVKTVSSSGHMFLSAIIVLCVCLFASL